MLNDDDYDDVQEKTNNLNTLDDIRDENEKLILQLQMLQKKAMEGQDVSKKFRLLEEKFEMIAEIGELIAKTNNKKEKTKNEKNNGN